MNYQYNHSQYQLWAINNEPTDHVLRSIEKTDFKYCPMIGVVVSISHLPDYRFIETLNSVFEQTYSHHRIYYIVQRGHKRSIKASLKFLLRLLRCKLILLSRDGGLLTGIRAMLNFSRVDYFAFLNQDDVLAPFALTEIVKRINDDLDADLLYSDEDKISEDALTRSDPHFKPDWSPDTLRSHNYIGNLAVIRKDLLDSIGFVLQDFKTHFAYDRNLRASEKAKKIAHISKILYHQRIQNGKGGENPESSKDSHTSEATNIQQLEAHLERTGLDGLVSRGLVPETYKVTYALDSAHKISIIIPNHDHGDDLQRCLESIVKKTSYPNYEIVIVENNSTDPATRVLYDKYKSLYSNITIIEWHRPFNYSEINNYAVRHANGDVLLFLNNDTEVIASDWLERMLEHAVRKEIGAVGAKLYYPDGKIQHAGVVIGIGDVAGHVHKHLDRDSSGYCNRLKIIQNLSAVTGACLMMRKDVFNEVEGFDDKFSHAFNDVDLCMKIRQKGYLILFTPYAELYHHESKTRGYEDTPDKQTRFKRETDLLTEKWNDEITKGDPYYNMNLTVSGEDVSLNIDLKTI